ncbi:MAG: MBL fold metallo-hydrolase [Muricauda sp.]|jgi:glyoxylase-like metal-dependent hydrolase (beta-lactamase superfamily II)/rhodanese-related sulfurtransferase|nr:rhodanese-like domain-containing protein [Allomuricauda sp.]MAU26403.1 MBL fold metallo-hydrolase [Allomuricauda sp.]MBC29515.1 MBL fold metallo-hydrolase [Allomuricauda sp.]|tara:strand:- start:35325 stop:36743 length:1419 start_codon:yes stop_codon:yes gene_type:complete
MNIEQIYTGCLAQGAYYIESEGEAAIIDPLREVRPYIERAERDNAKIKYIFETHFHADFVSGHITLSKETGAPIVYGPNANPSFEAIIAEDGQEFKLGKLTIVALHTPGHTMESTTYLLRDEHGKDRAIFSGDTLFLGDVGRPDLAQKAANMTQEDLAGILYDSLRNKIMPLADDVIVYPAHGAGSACGKNMMKETVDTLGNQKKMNYALRADMTREEFIKEVTDGLLPPPQYFPLNVKMNKEGYDDIDEVLDRGNIAMSPDAFETAANETGAVVLDVRHQEEFAMAHVPRSIFIGLNGSFAPWVGALIADVKQPILLIAPEGKEEEAITRLSRVGFDGTIGYLKGGVEAWKAAGKQVDSVKSVDAKTFEQHWKQGGVPVFDVRKESEYTAEHVEGAHLTPLDFINDHLAEFPKDKTFYLHCAGGYRSMIAASILKSRGIHNLVDVAGGFADIKKTDIPVTDYVCPTTKSSN